MAAFDISALAGMLDQTAKEQDARDAAGGSGSSVAVRTPGTLVPASISTPSDGGTQPTKDPDAIWDQAEVQSAGDGLNTCNECGRKRPKYDILYKQHVGAEDVYLGMGDMDPSSSSCDAMTVKVELPGQRFQDLDLDVKERTFVLTSSDYRLATYLPYKVDHRAGDAKWLAEKSTLTVTLPIIRDDT